MSIEFIKPHKGRSTGRDIRSRYTADGSYARDLPTVETVGALVALLAQLPADLPLSEPMKAKWFNVGDDDECLGLAEADADDDE